MKNNRIYLLIILCWVLLIAGFFSDLLDPIERAYKQSPYVFWSVITCTIFVLYFWLNGVKDFVYSLYFYIFYTTKKPEKVDSSYGLPLVEIVYCTHNDFTAESLLVSMQQDYLNSRVLILDDSTDNSKILEIQNFGEKYHCEVIRRDTRKGHKAGNLNNYLKNSKAEFFVVLDSDEIIPSNFITSALHYFEDPRVAVVQGNHVASEDKNLFMRTFSDGVESHWNTYQAIKHSFGFLSFLGHGAMIRKNAYDEVGGFPELVAEDLCFSIELRNKGYYVAFAPEIVCFEQYPIDYFAFKKRHAKWSQGNMEFIKAYTWKLIISPMAWYEKLDIVLFTYSLPLSVIFALYIAINIIVFPVLRFNPNYNWDMLAPTFLFLLSPMINDLIYYSSKKKPANLLIYGLATLLLYGSMFYISFAASFLALFTQAQFIVTPKNETSFSIYKNFWLNRGELFLGGMLSGVSYHFLHSIFPVLLITIPSFSSLLLAKMAVFKVKEVILE